jgi:hypothetical protein
MTSGNNTPRPHADTAVASSESGMEKLAGGWRKPPSLGVCDVPKGHAGAGLAQSEAVRSSGTETPSIAVLRSAPARVLPHA